MSSQTEKERPGYMSPIIESLDNLIRGYGFIARIIYDKPGNPRQCTIYLYAPIEHTRLSKLMELGQIRYLGTIIDSVSREARIYIELDVRKEK